MRKRHELALAEKKKNITLFALMATFSLLYVFIPNVCRNKLLK